MNVQGTAGSPWSVNVMPPSSGSHPALAATSAEHLFAPKWRELESVNARMQVPQSRMRHAMN